MAKEAKEANEVREAKKTTGGKENKGEGNKLGKFS